MSVLLRRASDSDIPQIIAMMEDHARYERAQFNPEGLAPKLSEAMQGCSPRLTIFVAEVDTVLMAYCSLVKEFSSWSASEYLHMDCLFVNSKARGNSLGKQLFDHALRFARDLEVSEIQWQTPEWNHGAIRFYERLGAKHSAKRRFKLNVA